MNWIKSKIRKWICGQRDTHSISERLNNNCTLCKHYNYNYIENKAKNETNHYCTNFVKLGETIEYNCNKFEPNTH